MEPVIMSGKKIAEIIKNNVKQLVKKLEKAPTLAIVTFGKDEASKIYMKRKLVAAKEVGIDAVQFDFSYEDYIDNTFWCSFENICERYDGIILQMPVPRWVDTERILEMIPYTKDVDGLTSTNIGKLWQGSKGIRPCTPSGIIELLNAYTDPTQFKGKHAVVIGRSLLVGKPIAAMLLDNDMTVTICHSKTKNLAKYTKEADLIVTAAGQKNLITADMVKQGVTIIDVSINRDNDGKLSGDVDFENVAPKCAAITPVPGGVGPMTVAMLMLNTYLASV